MFKILKMNSIKLVFLMLLSIEISGQNILAKKANLLFPADVTCTPQPYYRYRTDGKPGREVTVTFIGGKLSGKVQFEVRSEKVKELTEISFPDAGQSSTQIILPAGVGIKKESQVLISIHQGTNSVKKTFLVTPMREWTVYIYPHSHVDIGYTNTQSNVEILHKRNIDEGIKLAEMTEKHIGEHGLSRR